MKPCERHGVLYNIEQYNSCAVCRSAASEPRLGLSSVLLAAIGVGLIGCGIAMASGPAMTALAEAGDRAIAETARSMRLDPNGVRAELEAVEAAVYTPPDSSVTQGRLISEAVSKLVESLRQLQGAPQPLLNRLGRELEAFSARSYSRLASDPSSRGMTTRTDWESVRVRLFVEAPWYRHSGAGGDAVPSDRRITEQ